MGIKRYVQLINQTAAITTGWVRLDNRYETFSQRAIQINLTSGDTVELQAIVKDVKGDKTAGAWLNNLQPGDITSLKVYAVSENDVLEGPWTYIRAIKAGTNGLATVEGFI